MAFQIIINLLTFFFLAFGIFFMVLAAVGLVRMPDVYHRMHAATKGVTLGIAGLLIAGAFSLSSYPQANTVKIVTYIALVIIFQFVANPVGAHMLARAARMDGAPIWMGTIGDEQLAPMVSATKSQADAKNNAIVSCDKGGCDDKNTTSTTDTNGQAESDL